MHHILMAQSRSENKLFMYPTRLLALFALFATVLGLAAQNNGQNDQGKTLTKTTVYVTKTVNGKLTTQSLVYKQKFKTTYTEAETDKVKSGQMGLGLNSGAVGHVRTYQRTTVLNTNEGHGVGPNVYAGGVGAVLAFVAAL